MQKFNYLKVKGFKSATAVEWTEFKPELKDSDEGSESSFGSVTLFGQMEGEEAILENPDPDPHILPKTEDVILEIDPDPGDYESFEVGQAKTTGNSYEVTDDSGKSYWIIADGLRIGISD